MNLNSIYETDSQNSFRRMIKNIFRLFNLYPNKIYEEMIECGHQRCKGHSDIKLFRLKIIETILNRLLGKSLDKDISYNWETVKRLEPSVKGNEENSLTPQQTSLKCKEEYLNKSTISLNTEESLDRFQETHSSLGQTARTAGDSSGQIDSTAHLREKDNMTARQNGQDFPPGQTARTADDSNGQVVSPVNLREKDG